MHELQQILLQKLPRLGELTFGCEVQYGDEKMVYSHKNNDFFVFVRGDKTVGIDRYCAPHRISIIGHPFTHADILEALGEDWAMTGDGQLLKYPRGASYMAFGMDMGPQWIEAGITLPHDLTLLDNEEWRETAEQLFNLLSSPTSKR